MRNEKTLKLRSNMKVTVLELRPRDIKNALGMMKDKGIVDFERMLTADWDDTMAKLSDVVRVDQGELDDLSFSEIETVREAFLEVNAAFFGLLAKMGIKLDMIGAALSAASTEPASFSSSEAMPASSITVGDSS